MTTTPEAPDYAAYIASERIALATPVRLTNGIYGIISGQNPNDRSRYRVTYFNRHFWVVRHVWLNRTQFEVVA